MKLNSFGRNEITRTMTSKEVARSVKLVAKSLRVRSCREGDEIYGCYDGLLVKKFS